MNAWQPIATAPRDGSPILVCCGPLRFIVRWWDASEPHGWSLDLGGEDECLVLSPTGPQAPTHWQELPETPDKVAQNVAQ